MDTLNITHLVLSGGGMKGVIFIGALRYMYIENLHKNITHIAANSIGSFVALFITFKLTIEEIEKIIYDSKMIIIYAIYQLKIIIRLYQN